MLYAATPKSAFAYGTHWQNALLLVEVQGDIPHADGISVFTIGSTSCLLNGVYINMEVAPYINENRTYMPIRYVAYAVGISDQGIIWNDDEKTVILIKDDSNVQLKIGSEHLIFNGATVYMDVVPEIVNGRTMLPAAWIATAFRHGTHWDDENQQVTIFR
jgi:hypothetical protein